jgi:hypothetical protein
VDTKEKELPKQPLETQDIMIWDFKAREWVKGFRKDIERLPQEYEFLWDSVAASATNQAPREDTIIDVERASSIAVQADTKPTDNLSTSVDVNVMASIDGAKWDTVPYAEMNLGDAEIKTMLVAPGPLKLRLRLDNNVASVAECLVLVKVRE